MITTFSERLPDTKSAKYRGYTFTRCVGSACRCDAKVVYDAKGKGKRSEYAVSEFPCDFAGRAFRLEKVGGESYEVLVADRQREDICDCPGFVRYGKCKHQELMREIVANNLLPSPLSYEGSDYSNAEIE